MLEKNRRAPTRYEIRTKEKLFEKWRFRIEEMKVSFERFDGTMSPEQDLMVFERGDAAAALLFDPSTRQVILVNQFRLPTIGKARSFGWLTETAAGMINPDETPEQCIIREIHKETGYQITRLTPVAEYFSSPGGSSEFIHLFYAEVRSTDRTGEGGGDPTEGENICLDIYTLQEFLRMLANREFTDPKVIIAGQWLRERQSRRNAMSRTKVRRKFTVSEIDSRRIVGFNTGDIALVNDIDIWVNPENTDMMMDRFFGRSMSATIRSLGAKKVPGNEKRIEDDTIGKALREAMGARGSVKPAFVIDTTSGALAKSHNVKRIYHVATVEGQIGEGVATSIETLEECVGSVLREIEKANNRVLRQTYRSVVFPMLGTGEAGLYVRDVAEVLVRRAIKFFKDNPQSALQEVYFQAYSEGDEAVLVDVMQELQREGSLAADKPVASPQAD